MATTTTQLMNEIYRLLEEPTDSVNFDYNTTVLKKLNNVLHRICKGVVVDLVTKQRYMAGDLHFLRRDHFITAVSPVSVGAAIATTDVTITATTANYSTTGDILISDDVITYTGKNATTFTGVTGVSIAHTTNEKIYQLYPVPSNISYPFVLYVLDGSGNKREAPYHDNRYPTSARQYYTILTKPGTGVATTNLLHIVGYSDEKFLLVYYLNSTDLTTSSTECVIPDPHALSILPPLVAGELLWEAQENEDALPLLQKGYVSLDEFYAYQASLIKKSREQIHPQDYNFTSIRGAYGRKEGYSRSTW